MAEGAGRGRGRALLFQKKLDDENGSAAASNEPPRPRGRAALLHAMRAASTDVKTTISGSNESGAGLSSGDATQSHTSSDEKPRGRGRAALFGSRTSTSGVGTGGSSLTSAMKAMDITASAQKTPRVTPEREQKPPPVRKHGINGQKRDVAVNYVKLDLLDPEKGIWEYDVIFGSEVDNRHVKSKLTNMHFLALGGKVKVYDMGSRLYTPMKTPEEITSGVYELKNGDKVKVTFKRKWQRKLVDCISILNIIMNRIKYDLQLISFGRSDYNPKARTLIPQHGLEIWPGCITAVDEYEGGIYLNCDVSHRVLQSKTVYDVISESSRSGRGGKTPEEQITTALLGMSVITKYNNRIVRVDDVDFKQNPMSTFEKNGKQITYVQYYEEQYNLTIKDKRQPLLVSRAKKKPMGMETVDILNYYVPELCSPTGLFDDQRRNFSLMKDVNAITQLTPPQRDQALTKFLRGIHENPKCKEILEDWGLRLPVQPVELTARTLEPETIHLGRGRQVKEKTADWGRALMQAPMLSGVNLEDWAIIYTARDSRIAETFYDKARDLANKIGITIEKPRRVLIDNDQPRTYCEHLKELTRLQIVVVIFPSQRDDRYSAVKKLCNADLGLPTQVINSKTLQKDPSKIGAVILKIMLQINCKLGGSLWGVSLPYREDGVMFCGVDVYHEAAQRSSSIIAFVCSLDRSVTRWTSGTARHARGQEISDKIIALFRDCLQRHREVSGSYPKRIIMFRDGTGDGQLRTVRDFEIPQMEKLFEQVSQEYSPALTYLIVQKRINTRFYCKSNNRMDNPPPGTILDTTVTRRDWYDFFLVSQNVRQGTVAPTHYIVVKDSSDMNVDTLQKITYKMTHLYYNWNGTVRVPAPCQYAHKLAYLVGQHVHESAHPRLQDTLYFL